MKKKEMKAWKNNDPCLHRLYIYSKNYGKIWDLGAGDFMNCYEQNTTISKVTLEKRYVQS